MYAYFPEMYPDETLYSVLARMKNHLGGMHCMQFQHLLFQERRFYSDFEIMGGLDRLSALAFQDRQEYAHRIANEHTFLPFYLRFQPADVADRCTKLFTDGNTRDLHIQLGINTFTVGRVTQLRFCSTCLSEMSDRYGEYYWRRAHNVPGIFVCPEHETVLQLSDVTKINSGGYDFIAADEHNCSSSRPMVADFCDFAFGPAQKLSVKCAKFFSPSQEFKSHQEWSDHYLLQMRIAGFARGPEKLSIRRLEESVNQVFGELYPTIAKRTAGRRRIIFPFLRMVRKARNAFHPFHHAMMQVFLDEVAKRDDVHTALNVIRLESVDDSSAAGKHLVPQYGRTIDWQSLDDVVLEKFREAASFLQEANPPERVTCAALERSVGTKNWFHKRRQRLPKCEAFIRATTESVADFQTRRVLWHADQFLLKDKKLSTAALLKAAGLSFEHYDRVESLMTNFVNSKVLTLK